MSDPSREKALEVALEVERLARQQAENDAIGSRDELNILKVKHAAEVLARQQAEREREEWEEQALIYRNALLDAQGGKFLVTWKQEIADLRAHLTLSEQARAQAEAREDDARRDHQNTTDRAEAAEQDRDEWKALAKVGTWHAECRPNREQAGRELAKSQAVIDKLADRISESEQARARLRTALETENMQRVAMKVRQAWDGGYDAVRFTRDELCDLDDLLEPALTASVGPKETP